MAENVLGVNQGGTGQTTLTDNGVLIGNGTGAVDVTAAGTTGQVLTGVTGGNPVWRSLLFFATMARHIAETSSAEVKYLSCLTASKYVALAGYTNVTIFDGSSWSNVAHGFTASNALGICSNGDVIVIGGGGGSTVFRRSTDAGATWGTVSGTVTTASYAVIARGGDNGSSTVWVCGHTNSASLGGISTNNGATWSNKVIFSAQSCVVILNDGGTGAGTEWLALCGATSCRKSTDNAANWAAGSTLTITPTWGVYAASKFWAINTNGVLNYCANVSAAWTAIVWGVGRSILNGFGYANSKFCIVDGTGGFWTCADPSSTNVWVREGQISFPTNGTHSIKYFGGKYYMVSGNSSTFIQIYTLE